MSIGLFQSAGRTLTVCAWASGLALLLVLAAPLGALLVSTSPEVLSRGLRHPLFWQSVSLSLWTTACSLCLTILMGTPLALWLARSRTRSARWAEVMVQLPIVVPPAVIGVALLSAFGRRGLFGPSLETLGIQLPFTAAAVVLAQLVVSAPFYVRGAASAFREVDSELITVARSLGASPWEAAVRVALPAARRGLLAGASLSWARSLGEFGATLVFAGNLAGRTQTLPLATFSALEFDLELALALSSVLLVIGGVVLCVFWWASSEERAPRRRRRSG